MAQEELHGERTEKSSFADLMPAELAATAKKRVEDFVNAQTELFEKLQESNRRWLERVGSEVNLASEFASKLTAGRSIPDAMTAYQEWATRRFEMMAEDSKQLLSDCQNFTEVGAHFLRGGRQSKSS
jgi:hypothetical protein